MRSTVPMKDSTLVHKDPEFAILQCIQMVLPVKERKR